MLLNTAITPLDIVSNTIGHLYWRSLADRRTDARLVILYKISHELVAIPQTARRTHTTSRILPEHALFLIRNTTHTLTTQTAIILSANNTKLEQSPPDHCKE
jgi:hypothetical protein